MKTEIRRNKTVYTSGNKVAYLGKIYDFIGLNRENPLFADIHDGISQTPIIKIPVSQLSLYEGQL